MIMWWSGIPAGGKIRDPHYLCLHRCICYSAQAQRVAAILNSTQRVPALLHRAHRLPVILHRAYRLPALLRCLQVSVGAMLPICTLEDDS